MGPALPWVALAFTVGSTAYQYQQQKKARKKAKAEAEARKGFELVIEGSPGVLPIIYGKAKVGGVRCFHNTSSNFNYTASNANKTFNINLGNSRGGEKNEFLIFQQAICQGGISSVKDIIINETQFLNDPVLYDNAGIRVDVHFSGGVVDPLLKANAPDRSTALFTNIAYANVYVKLNRDDPQFGGVPDIQFLVEGRKVRKVLNGILQTTYVYSNNPAWVLLDYLLEFRKVPVEDIILSSFEQAAALADTVKLTGATVGGNFYRPALDTESAIFGRDIPLYETNIALDSAKPFRENVEAILETMGDARLVWSQGKYKLNAQYPGVNNENIVISDYITDDDLVLGKPITINWPSAEERLNNVTIRFNNESENFKEDTVSWPNKPNSAYTRGIGGFVYPAVSGWDTSEGGRLLNAYGVWNKGSNTTNLVYKIKAKVTGDHILRFTADDVVSGGVGEYTFYPNAWALYLSRQSTGVSAPMLAVFGTDWRSVKTKTIFLEAGKVYEIKLNATNNKDIKGIAATLTDPSNVVIWTTREPSYAGFEEISSDNTAYLTMLAEDNNVELETDIFLQGTTDYYHAKAKAEELVRTSRTAFNIKFTYIAKDKYLEPGDVIQLSSENIQIGLEGPLYIRVSSISLKPDFQCEIQGTRFDGTQLAWNVADNEYLKPISSYSEELPAPYYLEYVPDVNDIHNGPGSLNWPPVDDSRIISYNLYMHKEGQLDAGGNNLFKKIGSTSNPPFGLPDLVEKDLIFGIKSVANTGRMSKMTVTNLINLVRAAPPVPFNVTAVAYGDRSQSVKITWEIPLNRPDGSIYNNHSAAFIYRSKVNDIALAQKIGESLQSTEYIDIPSEFGTLYYWVKFISYAGVVGTASESVSLSVDFWQVFTDSVFKPPAPTNLQAMPGFGQILLKWDRIDYTQGGGHNMSLIYAKDWPEGELQPVFNNNYLVASVPFAEIYSHAVSPGSRWVYWIKELSRGSGVSDGFAGPVSATSEETVTDVLGALTSNGFDTNTEPFVFFSTETTLPDGTVIQPGTYLKRGYIAALSVDDGKIKNVSADKIHTGFLSADRIESQSLDSTKINTRGLTIRDESGEVIFGSGTGLDWSRVAGANKPENGATVGADSTNLKAGVGVNMVFNGDYTDGLAGTTVGYRSGGDQHILGRNLTNYTVQGEGTACITQPGTPGAEVIFDADIWNGQAGQYFAVTPGKKYEISAWLNCHRCEGRMSVLFLDAAGTQLQYWVGNAVIHWSSIASIADMQQSWAIATAPATAVKAYLIVRGYNIGSNDPYVFFSRVYFGEAGAGQTEPSPWSPGRGISQITSSNVTTYIDNAAIGNAQIGGNLWSTNWNYAGGTGWLLDRSGNFYGNNIYARGDIEASSLKANTAMVNTLNIAGNAVTVPVAVEYPSAVSYTQGGAEFSRTEVMMSTSIYVNVASTAVVWLGRAAQDGISLEAALFSGHSNFPTGTEIAHIALYNNGGLVKKIARKVVGGSGNINATASGVVISNYTAVINLAAGWNTIEVKAYYYVADGTFALRRYADTYLVTLGAQR